MYSNKGVTLVELSLVCVILSVILMVSWPVLNKFARRNRLENTCTGIANTLRYTRGLALNDGKKYSVDFDLSEKTYPVKDESGQYDDRLNSKRVLPENISFKDISANKVVFGGDGITEDFMLTLQDTNNNMCSLKLQGTTGRCEIITNYR